MGAVRCHSCVRHWYELTNIRYCLEHGLGFDGVPDPKSTVSDVGTRDIFFTEIKGEKFVPRSIFVDLDPSPIDEIRSGGYRQLFHPELLISGKEDAANNYARGHYTVGKDLVESVMDRVRRVAGRDDSLLGAWLVTYPRQLELSTRFPDFPLLWWRYRLWVRSSTTGTTIHWIWQENKAWICGLSSPTSVVLCCRALQCQLNNSLYFSTSYIMAD